MRGTTNYFKPCILLNICTSKVTQKAPHSQCYHQLACYVYCCCWTWQSCWTVLLPLTPTNAWCGLACHNVFTFRMSMPIYLSIQTLYAQIWQFNVNSTVPWIMYYIQNLHYSVCLCTWRTIIASSVHFDGCDLDVFASCKHWRKHLPHDKSLKYSRLLSY